MNPPNVNPRGLTQLTVKFFAVVLPIAGLLACQSLVHDYITDGYSMAMPSPGIIGSKGHQLTSRLLSGNRAGHYLWKTQFGNIPIYGEDSSWTFYVRFFKLVEKDGKPITIEMPKALAKSINIRYYLKDASGKCIMELTSNLSEWTATASTRYDRKENSRIETIQYYPDPYNFPRIAKEREKGNVFFSFEKHQSYELIVEVDVPRSSELPINMLVQINLEIGGIL